MRTRGQRAAMWVGVAVTVLVWGAIALLAGPMWPVPEQTPAEFWSSACGIDSSGRQVDEYNPAAAFVREDGAWQASWGMDSLFGGRAPSDAVLADFPRVQVALERLAADPAEQGDAAVGYRRWKALPAGRQRGVDGFLQEVADARTLRQLAQPGALPGTAARLATVDLELRRFADKTHRYWINIVFEMLFFPGVVWFFLWSAVRRRGVGRQLAHAAVAPFLLLAPLWLGYCMQYSSTMWPRWGVRGGVLYSWLLPLLEKVHFARNAGWETAFFRTLPRVMAPLSQAWWDERMLNDPGEWGYTAGPVQAAIGAAILCGAVLAWRYVPVWWRQMRRSGEPRGFEVLQ